jgi:hypothetical protein
MIDELIAGDTLDFLDSVPEYPPADGWTLAYRLVPRFTSPVQAPIDITASTSGSDYRVQAAAGVTATWAAGYYTWSRWVEKAGPIRQSLGSGQIRILENPAAAVAGFDGRTSARKVFDSITAVIEGRATKDQEEYSIAGRSLKRTPIEDLLVLRDRYFTEVQNEEAAAGISAGQGNPRNFGVRFNRV